MKRKATDEQEPASIDITTTHGCLKVGDLITVSVPTLVRVTRMARSNMSPQMRRISTEVVTPPKNYGYDVGVNMPIKATRAASDGGA